LQTTESDERNRNNVEKFINTLGKPSNAPRITVADPSDRRMKSDAAMHDLAAPKE